MVEEEHLTKTQAAMAEAADTADKEALAAKEVQEVPVQKAAQEVLAVLVVHHS